MKTKKQIKERIETAQQLADRFYKDWNVNDDNVSYNIYRRFVEDIEVLQWVLEN